MAHSACGTLTTWKLPGRLCGMWVDTAACGRGAPRGGLECKPARRPERKQEGREEQSTLIEDRSGKQPRCSRAPGDLLHWFWMETPRGWLSRVPGKAAHDHTPDKPGTQHMTTEPVGRTEALGHLLYLQCGEEGDTYCGRGRGGMSQGQGL